ncbi:type II/IV secretion system protein [Marinobacter sp. BW6]|nr:type II/IV secretion system protein [Marinobacter sp. BW6]
MAPNWVYALCENLAPSAIPAAERLQGSFIAIQPYLSELTGKSDHEIAKAIASQFDLPLVDLEEQVADSTLLRSIPGEVARRHHIFPVTMGQHAIIVAACHPFDEDMLANVGFLTGLHVDLAIASVSSIQRALDENYEPQAKDDDVQIVKDNAASSSTQTAVSGEESAVAALVSDMLAEAFEERASDIHLEPFAGSGLLRYRVDGVLRQITSLPERVSSHVTQRIKSIAGLNVANRMIPQDGGLSITINGQPIDLRVSSIPVKDGEKVVIRLLVQNTVQSLKDVGLRKQELDRLLNLLTYQAGVILISGPTGSGKSTTLYAALKQLHSFERCIVTVEDPIEYKLDGIAQIRVNRAQGVTFASALRSILRQDPDIILIGEIRDEETASIALRAANTGHLVLSTIHTNDAVSAIPRLTDLGTAPTVIADTVCGVLSQRLMRKLCSNCKRKARPGENTLVDRLSSLKVSTSALVGDGCNHCGNTGYRGRFPILEVVPMTRELADAIRDTADTQKLRSIAKDAGARSLAEVAFEAVNEGDTSVEEAHRVLGELFWASLRDAQG